MRRACNDCAPLGRQSLVSMSRWARSNAPLMLAISSSRFEVGMNDLKQRAGQHHSNRAYRPTRLARHAVTPPMTPAGGTALEKPPERPRYLWTGTDHPPNPIAVEGLFESTPWMQSRSRTAISAQPQWSGNSHPSKLPRWADFQWIR